MGISNYGIAFESSECQIKSGNNNEYTIAHLWHIITLQVQSFYGVGKAKIKIQVFIRGLHTHIHID